MSPEKTGKEHTPTGGTDRLEGDALDHEQALKELDRHKADFFAMVTHDLKSPLSVVMGYTDLLLSSKAGTLDPDSLNMIASIRKSGQKIIDMVEDFLTLSKMESGRLELNLFPATVGELLHGLLDEFASLAGQKGLAFSAEVEDNLPRTLMDRRLVERAVANMLQNAVNYTPRGGSVTLKAERLDSPDGGFIVLSVSDTGPGVHQDERGRVFEKYYRSPRISGVKGSGLGLAIVKAVAEAHGGRVELKSEEGKESTFKLFLPVRQ